MAEIKASSEFKTIWLAGSQKGAAGFRNGAADEALVNCPHASCLDTNGNVVFTDSLNHAVRLFDVRTHAVLTLAGTGQEGFVDDCKAELAQFAYPYGVAADDEGTVYISDNGN